MSEDTQVYEDATKYILFQLGTELYGTPLLGVREVVEPLEPKQVPNTVGWFTGVINIRGQIIGVIDLRKRFGHSDKTNAHQALMVFDTQAGPLAALVDKVEAVVRISDQEIEKRPNVQTNVPMNFLLGIASAHERLVTLIDLAQVLGAEELKVATSY